MTGNVVSLGKASVQSERREAFLQTVAQAFERYVAEFGEEPDGVVYAMGGAHQSTIVGWDVHGRSETAVTSVLSMSAVHMLAEAQKAVRAV